MAKKCEDKVIITMQEYNKAIDGILGDMNPENCTSTVEIYAMFSKIAQIITDSQRYDEMNVVDSAKIDDSIECIKTMLKSMIGDETFNYAVMSHLGCWTMTQPLMTRILHPMMKMMRIATTMMQRHPIMLNQMIPLVGERQ